MNEINLDSGAEFSQCIQYRYALWRIWDKKLPLVMFIGLNPSNANEKDDDPTIKSVCRISKNNGYGGVYMMNCYPYVSTDPNQILLCSIQSEEWNTNQIWLLNISKICKDVVFAWGDFNVVKKMGIDRDLSNLFPNAKALHINKSGSPKHPLYCKSDTKFIKWVLS